MEKEKLTLNDFHMLSLLGVGNYAKVILVRKKNNSKIYALKVIKKVGQTLKINKDHAYLEKLETCNHPFICKLRGSFQTQKKLYFVLQYCPGGELFGVIRRVKRLSQQHTKFYAAQILLALQHMHQKQIVYRDLKPQNVLIDEQGYIKLTDFGLSFMKKHQIGVKFVAGTPEYLAPQNFNEKAQIGYEVDWWCFGTIIFEMLIGFPPFYAQKQDPQTLKNKIINKDPPLILINNPILKDLLKGLLAKDPKNRLGRNSTQQIKDHPWFFQIKWEKILEKNKKASFIPNLKNQTDIIYFEVEGDKTLSPPDQLEQNAKSTTEKYHQFSLSWRSSEKSYGFNEASPPEICIHIDEQ